MNCLSLIGMPGAGKSTVGVLLAKRLGLDFLDTDLAIQLAEGRTLEEILAQDGHLALRAIEARVLAGLNVSRTVLATGGSAVYAAEAMQHLKSLGPVIYLEVPLEELERRIPSLAGRGIAAAPGTTLASLAAERTPLYERTADLTVRADLDRPEAVVDAIVAALPPD